LRQFLPHVKVETGPNRGGNRARNRGFELSAGEYIQYLDADDYLDPEKVARQVEFLEETKADVVYGDWTYRRHLRDDRLSYLDEIEVSGDHRDILASTLAGWWVFLGAILYRRRIVSDVGGWDEGLSAAQDSDFFRTVVFSGANVRYQPGCHSYYRQYGAITVSSSNLKRWVESHYKSLRKADAALQQAGRLTDVYREALALGYFGLARGTTYYTVAKRPSFAFYSELLDAPLGRASELSPHFRPPDERCLFASAERLLGFEVATRYLFWICFNIRLIKAQLRRTHLLNLYLFMRGIKIMEE
jgi:glycosyltransferase involved in cell wall biosynthesis